MKINRDFHFECPCGAEFEATLDDDKLAEQMRITCHECGAELFVRLSCEILEE